MKKLCVLILGLVLFAAACAPSGSGADETDEQADGTGTEPAAAASGGGGASEPLVIGLTVSETGSLTAESQDQFKGLQLWADGVNEAGGISAGGTSYQVEFATYNDESEKTRVQQLYTRLITEDQADFLISPYSSGLAEAAAVVAEQNQKLMLATGAASDSIFSQGFRNIFQIYTPASRYLTGSVDLLMDQLPDATRVAIVHEEDTFSTDVAEAARAYADEQGLEVVLFEGYPTGTTSFDPFINRIEAAKPDAIVGGGHFEDGSTLVRQLRDSGIDIQMISILVAPSVPDFAQLGDAADGIVGPSQWEPNVSYSEEQANTAGLTWFGPSPEDVTTEYETEYGDPPGYHAAGGYAAGLVLQKAIEDAGSVDAEAVRSALEGFDLLTFFGEQKFSTGEDYGRQVGHEMVQIQWQQVDDELQRVIIWPPEAQTEQFQPLGQ